jgi:hypothetical protein
MTHQRFRVVRLLGACLVAALVALTAHVVATAVLRVTVLPISTPTSVAGARFGESVAGLGDVNGDGVGDLIVGAPGADRVFMLSGATLAVLRTMVDPNGTGHLFGYTVANAGDVNGDGVDDIAVGAPGPVPGPLPLPCALPPCPPPDPAFGRAFIFSGSNGALIHTLIPSDEFAGFGVSVASLGDVNGDGVPDVAVGMAPTGSPSSIGRVYAFSGSNGAVLWEVDEPGGKQFPSFGQRLASIGDLNGDGRRDLLVSAPFHDVNPDPNVFVLAGRVYLVSGATGAILRTHADPTPADQDLFGSGIAAVGDQNADGFEDYAIGEAGKGIVHLINGKTGASAGTISAPAGVASFGFTIADVGDQNGDGHADFWVGAPDSGRIYLLSWSGATLASVVDSGPASTDGGFGWSLAATHNLGGDSPDDLIIGKPAGGSGAASIVLLAANKPPIARAGADQTHECTASTGTAVTLDGSASSDPDGDSLTFEWRDSNNVVIGTTPILHPTLGLGTHTFTLTVSDNFGGNSTDAVNVTVADTTPPALSLSVAPSTLWPPNHRLVPIGATVTVTDACDAAPSIQLIAAISNEPDNGLGDGNTSGDIQDAAVGTDDRAFLLRAERSGTGAGRIYTVTYRATDASSNVTVVSAQVVVPH